MSDCFNDHDADRIVELALKPGAAANDPIVLHLGNRLIPAIERHGIVEQSEMGGKDSQSDQT